MFEIFNSRFIFSHQSIETEHRLTKCKLSEVTNTQDIYAAKFAVCEIKMSIASPVFFLIMVRPSSQFSKKI